MGNFINPNAQNLSGSQAVDFGHIQTLGDAIITDGEYPHYDTPVSADFNDLLYKINVMTREWNAEHNPGTLLLLYEFQGWYKRDENDPDGATIQLNSEYGAPNAAGQCRATFTALSHVGAGYSNNTTLFVWFSNSNLDSIYVEQYNSPFLETNFSGDFPPNAAWQALVALRYWKNDQNYFNEGWITYRIGVLPVMAEPVYQFGGMQSGYTFDTIGMNTLRLNVPAGYDSQIPHEHWDGIDPELQPAPAPEPEKKEDKVVHPSKVSYKKFDFNNDGKTTFSEFYNY